MDIAAEIKEIAKQHMQQAWDRHLIVCWQKYKNCNMPKCAELFYKQYKGVDHETFGSLRRVPKYKNHWHCCVTRFVAAYLPALNNVLLNDRLSVDEIVALLAKYPLDTQRKPEDTKKATAEKREVKAAEQAHKAAKMSIARRRTWREDTSRSNWNACK